MIKFEPEETEILEFEIEEDNTQTQVQDPNKAKESARLYEAAIGVDSEEAERKINVGMEPLLRAEVEGRVQQFEAQTEVQEIDDAITKGASLEDLEFIKQNSLFGKQLVSPTEALLSTNTEFSKLQRKGYRRALMLSEVANNVLKQTSTGTLDTIGEFGDLILSGGISELFFGATDERNETAQVFSNLLFSDKEDEDVVAEAEEIFRGMADQGLFTGESSLYLQMFIDQAVEGGVGSVAFSDNTFKNIDIAGTVLGGVSTAGKGLVRAIKAGNSINTIAKLKDSDTAASLAVRAINTGDNSSGIVENSSISALRPAKRDKQDFTGVGARVTDEIDATNNYVDFMINDARFAGVIDDNQLTEIAEASRREYLKDFSKSDKKRLLDFEIEYDEFNNLFSHALMGTQKGNLYTNRQMAQRAANTFGGEVVESQMKDGKVGYALRMSSNISQSDKVKKTDVRSVMSGFMSGLMSSTARTSNQLDSILKINEGQSSRVFNEISKNYSKVKRKAGRGEIAKTDHIIKKLNDDPKYAFRNTPFTTEEFAKEYRKLNNESPPQKTVDYYLEQLKLNDFEYKLRADLILKRAVEAGEELFEVEGKFIRGKIVSEIDETTPVWDETSKSFREAKDFPEGSITQLVEDTYEVGGEAVRHIHSAKKARRPLKHSDVLGYNPGGSRVYSEGKFFVKQTGVKKLADGAEVPTRPKSFMSVVTETEARLAAEQINNILSAISKSLGDVSALDEAALKLRKKDLLSDSSIQEVIEGNTEWNVGIGTTDDFIKFAEEWDLDLTRQVDFAPDGEKLLNSRTVVGNTIGEDFLVSTNARRGSRPLLGYGGNPAQTLDPSEAIERSSVIALNRFADYSYQTRAINGWLKASSDLNLIDNLEDLKGMSSIEKMRNAKISTSLKDGRKLEAERNFIESKLSYRTQDMQKWDQFVTNVADYVYDKGAKKVSTNFRETTDPVGFLRSMAFNLKLGLFAVDQFMVQASQIINIVGISEKGIQGSLNVIPLRMALVAPNNETVTEIARRISGVTGVNEEDFKGMLKWIRESGRDLVDQNIIELDGNQTLYKTGLRRVLDAGRMPFNEGELTARIAGMSTAFLDYRKAFPEADAFSDAGRQWITRRQDVLTASMTSASSANWQRSALSVPTQFMTYSMRMMEQLSVPGILSTKERLKLIGAQTVFWGGVGLVPYGYFLDRSAYNSEIDLNPNIYNVVRYGAIDYLLTEATGSDTAVSERLGAVGGVIGMIKNMSENSFFENIVGPSGGIAQDVGNAAISLGVNMFSGKWDYTSYDFQRLGRNITSVNRVYNVWVAEQQREYLNRKTGEPLLQNLDAADSFSLALGIPLKESQLAFTLYERQNAEKENIKEHANRMREMRRIMLDYLEEGDRTSAKRVSDDIAAMYNILSPYNQAEVLRTFNREDGDFLESMYERELNRGHNSVLTQSAREMLE